MQKLKEKLKTHAKLRKTQNVCRNRKKLKNCMQLTEGQRTHAKSGKGEFYLQNNQTARNGIRTREEARQSTNTRAILD